MSYKVHCAFRLGLKVKAAILADRHFRPASTVLPFSLLRSSLLSSLWTECLSKVHVFSIPASHRLPAFCHQCPRSTLIFVVTVDAFSKSATQTLLRLKTFVLCSFNVFSSFLP